MELLKQPEIKTTYDKCKYRVKVWEYQFKKKKGRIPSKLDIKEASSDVRQAYKTYFNLKSAALEESFLDLEGFSSGNESDSTTKTSKKLSQTESLIEQEVRKESPAKEDFVNTSDAPLSNEGNNLNNELNTAGTWGVHLNNKKNVDNEQNDAKVGINSTFSQKLFEGSKFSKRNPRKSLSFSRKKSEPNMKPTFLSQPETSTQFDEILRNESTTLPDNVNIKIIPSVSQSVAKPLNVIPAILNNNFKQRQAVDVGWLERITNQTNVDFLNSEISDLNVGTDNCDIIENSDDDELSNKILPITKKFKLDTGNAETSLKNVDLKSKRLDFSNIFNNPMQNNDMETPQHSQQTAKLSVQNKPKKGASEMPISEKLSRESEHFEPNRNLSVRKSSRQHKKVIDLNESSHSEKDPFDFSDSDDPEFDPANDGKKNRFSFLDKVVTSELKSPNATNIAKSTTKTKKTDTKSKEADKIKTKKARKTSKELPKTKEEMDSDGYELEYSVKQRIKTVPRITNIRETLKKRKPKEKGDNDIPNRTKDQQAKQKLEKKISSGTLNENYVRIDLKKKIYVKGRKRQTFSRYKKQMWKNKKKALTGPDMDMGGCDGGVVTCFTCGQTGHFSRNCKTAAPDKLLPLEAEPDPDHSYPTLEEAAQMARDSPLAIRKSKLEGDNDNQADNSDDELLIETLQLEEEINKIDMQMYTDTTATIKPYYDLNNEGSIVETPKEVFETLEKFGHESFRPGQEQAIMRILSGKSTLVMLSTGSGKSLCYQLPAYLYSRRGPCICLVISPLISLMEDQVTGIPSFLKAACLHTNQTKTQKEKIMTAIAEGGINILLISPEAVVAGERSSGFGSILRKLPPIAFACIDEAHCVSQWSHNFRPSYLMICRVLQDQLGINTILGLTATATRATSDDIISHLRIPDGRLGIINDIPLPSNLYLTVSNDIHRDRAVVELLLSERFKDCRSVIVYCTRRQECERIASYLRTCLKEEVYVDPEVNKKRKRLSMQAEPYHAGLSAQRRRSIQNAFMSGQLRIVVATIAFGMGINKRDIRAVIHYNMPSSFESYVQEVGRAGRDGLPAFCHVFLSSQGDDENELLRHVFGKSMDRHTIRKLLQRIFVPCSCKYKCPRHEVAFSIKETVEALDIPEETIETLLCYLELHNKQFIQVLNQAYVNCKIVSYAGRNEIRKVAKDCPPLAMALALHKKTDDENVFQFPVVDVASAIGWDSGICKHKLKNLEWMIVNNQTKRSNLSVKLSDLGFRILAPGNLSEVELDEALDSLYQRVTDQERANLIQLHLITSALTTSASDNFKKCVSDENENLLKSKIREYFENPKVLNIDLKNDKQINEDQISADVRTLINMYKDNMFTGRAVARIFYGIQSPNYPAFIWGRCKFWRAHLGTDFNTICQIATKQILKMQ